MTIIYPYPPHGNTFTFVKKIKTKPTQSMIMPLGLGKTRDIPLSCWKTVPCHDGPIKKQERRPKMQRCQKQSFQHMELTMLPLFLKSANMQGCFKWSIRRKITTTTNTDLHLSIQNRNWSTVYSLMSILWDLTCMSFFPSPPILGSFVPSQLGSGVLQLQYTK